MARPAPRRVTSANADTFVQVDVDPFDVDRMTERVWDVLRGDRLTDFLEGPAHDYLEDDIVQRFAYEGDRKSGDWAPLSPATQVLRRRMGFSADEINIRTSEMFQTLTQDHDTFPTGSASAVMILPGGAAEDGAMAQKIRTAQEGRPDNPRPGFGPTPARPVLAVDEADLQELLERLNRWIIWEVAGGFV